MDNTSEKWMKNIDKDKTWRWLKSGDLKACTEVLICAAQDQALRANYMKDHFDNTLESPLCRLVMKKEIISTIS